ncbi:MAG: acyl-CoA dehydrogenase family protein [Deltaproteobacteria bacterium]|nr:acyl-CoA dehydrogenase family protein [Deltaproteobacteria bacterium]
MSEHLVAEQEQARGELAAWREFRARNPLDADPFFLRLVRRYLGARWSEVEPRLRATAAAARDVDADVAETARDEHLPVLRRHDDLGRPIEEVVFHPAHERIGRAFWSSGVLAVLAEPGNDTFSGALCYLLDRGGEAGHACPVACTAGAIRLLQRVGTDDQRRRWLPALLETEFSRRLHAAQFVTEVQGGSDVGRNGCRAEPVPDGSGRYRIRGEKWFCSVADAGLFVVSARVPGAAAGTRGLGLFLVPRRIDDRPNGFRLRRLKWKLGTRALATGEIEFDGALAEPIGRLDQGFRNLVAIVLDTSRVHNALAACGVLRRALEEAHAFAAHRVAFDRPIAGFPGVQELLARIKASLRAALASTFRLLDWTDRIAAGNAAPELEGARRIGVMINKYGTALACTRGVRDAIEVLGGNGTIEDFSPLPRLYRDAIVVESWEGTHNTLVAQVLRDFATRRLHEPWLAAAAADLAALEVDLPGPLAARARALFEEVRDRIRRVLEVDARRAEAVGRHVVDRMCRLTDWLALCDQLRAERLAGEPTDQEDVLELYRRLHLDPVDPQDDPLLAGLWARVAAGT